MILFKKRVKAGEKVIRWKDTSIPAKLFFDMLTSGDYSEIGNIPENERQDVFMKIYDEYIMLDNNEKVIEWYKKQCRISLLEHWIERVTVILYTICYVPMTDEERLQAIEILNSIEERPASEGIKAKFLVNFDINKPVLEEIHRIQNTILGTLKTRLNIEKSTEKKQKEGVKYEFIKDLTDIELVLGKDAIEENVSLKKFVYYKKQAENKINAQKQATKKPIRNGR